MVMDKDTNKEARKADKTAKMDPEQVAYLAKMKSIAAEKANVKSNGKKK
ncbi:hypothetical protein SS50377_26481 [Spironucleus salmonicida]|uniref:Uncharacterized protein n=1 Tax=Spironucleus salmonicida TaxID=348837 RepID=A0A9P8RX52_9EUKA|nr:hypothetical protein SS50377_26481 [Spironucleus salmonicida]